MPVPPARPFVPTPRSSRAATPAAAEPSAGAPGSAGSEEIEQGFGPLQSYIDRPGVTDVLVNGAGDLWLDTGAGLQRQQDWVCPSEDRLRALAVRLVGLGGRHVDEATPCADVRLGRGIRVHAVLPPVSRSGTLLSLRVPPERAPTLQELEDLGAFGRDAEAPAVREYLERAVVERKSLLLCGPAGSGKTTLLSALLTAVPQDQRIIALEDVAELRVTHPHFVGLEARQANTEGAGAIGVRELLREALRMRPDRLVLGECRGAEVFDLFTALNTGHEGGAGTMHANSLEDVPARIEALGALAGLGPLAIARLAASAIDVVVQLERSPAGRGVAALGALELSGDGRLTVTDIYGR